MSLRILMPTSCFLPKLGGVEVGLHNIAKRLTALGHKPHILIPFSSYLKNYKLRKKLPYKILPLPPKLNMILLERSGFCVFLLERYFLLLQFIYRFDIWHTTVGYPIGVAVIRFAVKRNIPHLVRCVGADIQVDESIKYGLRLDPRVDDLVKKWLPQADSLIAISNSVVKEYELLNVDPRRVERIPNGVDIKRFQAIDNKIETRKRLGITSDDFVMLSVGRYHPKKNFESIINIAKILKDKASFKYKFIIAGAGNQCLNDLIDRELLSDVIKVVPTSFGVSNYDELPDQELISLYKASDIFLFPSFIETFGIVLIEAMAARLPIITSDAPGCIDIVEQGKYGRAIPPLNIEQYANDIVSFKMSKEMVESYSALSEERAAQFSWDSIVEKYCKLYVKLIKEKSVISTHIEM
jgi:glycosyltransferase involved in cell wall biosynthesis